MERRKLAKSCMWKDYDIDDYRTLNDDTYQLSQLLARYEVHCERTFETSIVSVQVRCTKGSKVYQLCEQLGYTWC